MQRMQARIPPYRLAFEEPYHIFFSCLSHRPSGAPRWKGHPVRGVTTGVRVVASSLQLLAATGPVADDGGVDTGEAGDGGGAVGTEVGEEFHPRHVPVRAMDGPRLIDEHHGGGGNTGLAHAWHLADVPGREAGSGAPCAAEGVVPVTHLICGIEVVQVVS